MRWRLPTEFTVIGKEQKEKEEEEEKMNINDYDREAQKDVF